MKYLVTGATGFLGSHLCERLLNEDNEIFCLDNFYTGSNDNILHLSGNPRFAVINHDIINPIYLDVDQIYNLACPASPVHYQYNPIKTIKTNVMGTINTLGLAKRVKATRDATFQAKDGDAPALGAAPTYQDYLAGDSKPVPG